MKSRLIIILGLLFLLGGCGPEKEILKIVSSLKESDSIYIKNETIKTPPGKQVLSIQHICDTITGKAKVIRQTIVRDGDSIDLLIDEKNNLTLSISNQEKTISELNTEITDLRRELIQSKLETDIIIKPPKWSWWSLFFNILLLIYVLNRIFKWIKLPFGII
ncbi:hypothetical protein [Galbibacter sp. BG1]